MNGLRHRNHRRSLTLVVSRYGSPRRTSRLSAAQKKAISAMAGRLASDPASNPVTGADLGAGPGAGTTTAAE
jgi:Mn-containing catalase